MAYFDENADLKRFDALGGASALFYLEGERRAGHGQQGRVHDAFRVIRRRGAPVGVLFRVAQERCLSGGAAAAGRASSKGFNWQPELRPSSPEGHNHAQVRPSERRHYEAISRPEFVQTERFFSGYMGGCMPDSGGRPQEASCGAEKAGG